MILILNLLFQIVLLLSLPINTSASADFALTNPGCTPICGNVSIPFPFGIEEDCYLEGDFAIDCNSNKPFLRNLNLSVLDISLDGTLRVNHEVLNSCDEDLGADDKPYVNLENTSFYYSQTGNRFTALGCNNLAYMSNNETVFGGCFSTCDGESSYNRRNIKINISEQNGCYGINCCQSKIPSYLQTLNVSVTRINYERNRGIEVQGCKSAFLVDQSWFAPILTNHTNPKNLLHVPVVLDWRISNFTFFNAMNESSIYRDSPNCSVSSSNPSSFVHCNCKKGYEGNPYLLQGCRDIDECKLNKCGPDACTNVDGGYYCYPPTKISKINLVTIVLGTCFGSLFLLVAAWWLYIIIKNRKEKKLKEKYFKQNGGLLLERQLSSSDGSVDRSKLFNSKDLDKATDHFNVDRKIGEGGQGTVYKGMLANGRIVAVKKSKVVDDNGKLQEFVNEVIILSEIKHRNIVELLGYCLETEVPLLVYEFIPNGTLFDHLHDPKEELLSLTWDMRLRIATEVADALSYLHSAASMAIYHRDIKSANILLDNKYRAKVADFGISKSIEIDQTHATTKVVKGTIGYMDPEYFQSRQFTNKSDVYSFGVVLVELLTEQKPISSKGGSLVQKFIELMKENHLFDILSSQVKSEGKDEEIIAVANLAYRCVNLKGSKRPTMKEASTELQRIRASENNNPHQNYEEVENMRSEVLLPWDGPSTSTGSTFDNTVPSTDFQPLLNTI